MAYINGNEVLLGVHAHITETNYEQGYVAGRDDFVKAMTAGGWDFNYFAYNQTSITTLPPFDMSTAQRAQCICQGCTNLKSIDFPLKSKKCSIFMWAFTGCTALEHIESINLENATGVTAMFKNCTSLQSIGIEGAIKHSGLDFSTCTALTVDTLNGIINALYDYYADGYQYTHSITLGTTNLNKLTDEQKAVATAKNWTLA